MRYLTLLITLFALCIGLASQTQPSGANVPKEPAGGEGGTPGLIQKALQQDTELSNANINVSVKGNEVELTGTVANKDQKKTAKHIAESNAAGMKVVDHLKVSKSENNVSSPTSTPPKN